MMTENEILSQALEKSGVSWYYHYEIIRMNTKNKETLEGVYAIIFNHEFAEGLWGNEWPEEFVGEKGLVGNFPYWQAELTQLVLQKKPLEYISLFLNESKNIKN